MLGKNFVVTYENADEYITKIAGFIKSKVDSAGRAGLVLGMSGGIDCSVAACLSKSADVPVKLIMMPDGDDMLRSKSMGDAMKLVEKFGFDYRVIDIGEVCACVERQTGELCKISRMNIRPRVRMTILYSLAQDMGRFVLGTGNLVERLCGYFTKWGDGASDLNPLGMLTKGEVRILARHLGVPEEIVSKPPSAGLFEGQTDEDELGFKYSQIDAYILKGTSGDSAVDKKLSALFKMSAHKLNPIDIFSG